MIGDGLLTDSTRSIPLPVGLQARRAFLFSLKWTACASLILALLLSILTCGATDIKFAWNASTNAPEFTNVTYALYGYTNDLPDNLVWTNCASRINVGTNLTCTISGIVPGLWFFGVRANALCGTNSVESEFSNILILDVPKPPTNMRTVILQYSGTLTNFYDVGFFKLRLP
jgi:hypothetical protein